MKMSEMGKEDFLKYRVEEKGNNREEVEKLWNEKEQEFKNMGLDDVDTRVKRALTSYFIRQDRFPTEQFEGIIIGATETDFGARWQYNDALQKYKENSDDAINKGLVDSNGNPLHRSGFNAGEIIDLKSSKQRQFLGVFKGVNDDKFIPGILTASGRNSEAVFPFGVKGSFKALKKGSSTAEKLMMTAIQDTNFVEEKKLSYAEIGKLLQDYYKENLMDIEKLSEYHDSNSGNYDRISVFKGDVFQLVDEPRKATDTVTGEEYFKNNVLGLNKRDSDETMTCFGKPFVPLNFSEIAQDVIAIGRTRKNQEGNVSIDLFGAFAPEEFQTGEKEYVEPKNGKEKVADETEW